MNEDTTEKSVEEILADEEKETPETNEENTTPEKVQEEKPEKSKEFQSLEAQKAHYREKAEKLEKQLSEKKVGGTNFMDNIKLGKALSEFSEEEFDEVVIRAKGRFNTLTPTPEQVLKASQEESFKDAIEARRKKLADTKKVPGSSSPDFAQPTKNYRDIAKMSKEEFREYAEKQEKGGRTGI